MADAILVTGGAGYLGSHVVVELGRAGYAPVALDRFGERDGSTITALYALAGSRVPLLNADVRDADALRQAFRAYPFRAVIHCAGLGDPADAELRPLAHYAPAFGGTLALAEVMAEAGVATLVAASSAAVYGAPSSLPVAEAAPLAPLTAFGRCARAVEDLCFDLAAANRNWRIALLRPFTVAGAHPSGALGAGAGASGLVARLAAIASGERAELVLAGCDWPTADGTALRDYVHVVDVARAHVAALRYLATTSGAEAFNVGTGRPLSTLAVVTTFERACGRTISRRSGPRSPGAIGALYASTAKAESLLQWQAEHGIAVICEDAWRWQRRTGAITGAVSRGSGLVPTSRART